MLTDEPQWIAVYTRPRAEKMVAARFTEAGLETYLPLIKEKHHWSDRIKLVEEPLFKSYVFVKITKRDQIKTRETNGVVCLVYFGKPGPESIATIPDQQIEDMRQMIAVSEQVYVHQTEMLKKGATVTIQEGAFAGMTGTLVSDCKDGNFSINIEALSLSIVTEVNQLILTPTTVEDNHKEQQKKQRYTL